VVVWWHQFALGFWVRVAGQLVSVSDGTKICSASDVIVSGSGRLALIKQRTAWVKHGCSSGPSNVCTLSCGFVIRCGHRLRSIGARRFAYNLRPVLFAWIRPLRAYLRMPSLCGFGARRFAIVVPLLSFLSRSFDRLTSHLSRTVICAYVHPRAMFPSATPTINGADLVVIITARVSVTSSVAAYSVCLQRDQHGRCTVGWLNWVPNYINTASALAPDVIAGERETAVHEFVRTLASA
jgi:hypothetical protein